jgi:hypothetical protein
MRALIRFERWVDDLSPVRQPVAWLGIALTLYLVLILVLVLVGGPALGRMSAPWVFVVVASGVAASRLRNRYRDKYDSAVLALRRRDQ